MGENYGYSLRRQLDKQKVLDAALPPHHSHQQLAEYVRLNVLAAMKELSEVLDEVGWKPWGTSEHFNREAFLEELADVQMFLDNLKLLYIDDGQWTAGLVDARFRSLMGEKIDQAIERHTSGTYGGFDGKN